MTVDVNQQWEESQAARAIAALEEAGIDLIEQPISKYNRAGMARLAARFVVPLMADEALYGPEDAFDLARQAAADVFALKVVKSGGLHATRRTAAVADAAGVSLYGGTMLEGTIGTLAAAQCYGTLPHLQWGHQELVSDRCCSATTSSRRGCTIRISSCTCRAGTDLGSNSTLKTRLRSIDAIAATFRSQLRGAPMLFHVLKMQVRIPPTLDPALAERLQAGRAGGGAGAAARRAYGATCGDWWVATPM